MIRVLQRSHWFYTHTERVVTSYLSFEENKENPVKCHEPLSTLSDIYTASLTINDHLSDARIHLNCESPSV